MSAFLRFVVEQTLDGRGGSLKEQVLGSELYGKGPEFNGAVDTIVRVEARRLRDKLREYYAEFPRDPILISLPKGTYIPSFEENKTAITTVAALPVKPDAVCVPPRLDWRWIAAASSLAALMGSVLTWVALHERPGATANLVKIASFRGQKQGLALSPDGRFIAFSSRGPEDTGKPDIWVQMVGSDALRRLTETPQFGETFPAWSPDGREIAFVQEGQGVFVVPQSGGPGRKVASSGNYVAWAPDGKSVLIRDHEADGPYSIYQILLNNLERRRLTRATIGDGDWRFSVSPDGSKLAFIRYERSGISDLYLVDLQGGEPRRLTNWNESLSDVFWTPDGRDLVYTKGGLWRISASVPQPGRGNLLPGIRAAAFASISRPRPGQRARLAFTVDTGEVGFRIVDLTAPLYDGVFHAVKPFVSSMPPNAPGQFSPDGERFTFVSGDPPQLWIARIDGTGRRQLTSTRGTELAANGWSPEGRQIVYAVAIDGNTDIFVMDAAGGRPKRRTFEASIDGAASWSRDGRWIYFTSSRAGSVDIWRMPSEGGEAVRMTYHGGFRPLESPDRKHLYYVDRAPEGASFGSARLKRVPVEGGPEITVLDGLTPSSWSMADSGIFFFSREAQFDTLYRYNFGDEKVTPIGKLASRMAIRYGMNVSADGRWALVPFNRSETELMLVDDFK
jgi:Tol biopolymer transport system component